MKSLSFLYTKNLKVLQKALKKKTNIIKDKDKNLEKGFSLSPKSIWLLPLLVIEVVKIEMKIAYLS